MATTSLWRIKGYLSSVLLYAQNPEKTTAPEILPVPENVNRDSLEDVIAYASRESATNRRQLVSGINCNVSSAREEMLRVKRFWKKEDGTVAYHGYQSFAKGEVAPDLAHKIGVKLANELWGDRYQVLVATHVDKESHIHTHFVINTVSIRDGIKYHRTKEDYLRMREVSDRLCREYALSVPKPQGKGKNYGLWQAEKNGKPTMHGTIRADIDRAITASLTAREFFQALAQKGYQFKLYGKSGQPLVRPSLKPPGAQKFFRFDNLGEHYSLEEINDRILENTRRKCPFPDEDRQAMQHDRQAHPPRTKAKGIAALYFYYCYELRIIRKYPESVKHMSYQMRQDLRRLEQLDAQTLFLGENNIETVQDLNAFREMAAAQTEQLKAQRKDLRNLLKKAIRKGDETEQLSLKAQIAGISQEIDRLRQYCMICDDVEQRAEQLQAEYQALKEAQNKEVDHEQNSKGGRTGRSQNALRDIN